MNDQAEQERDEAPDPQRATWGPRLFLGTLVALLGFFYWLLIYSGGASGHTG